MNGDELGLGFGDGGRRGRFGFDAAGIAGTGCCCCGRDIEAAAAMAGGDWSSAFEIGSGCGMEDVAEGAGQETHGRLELVVVIAQYSDALCDEGEAEQVMIGILII